MVKNISWRKCLRELRKNRMLFVNLLRVQKREE